MGLRCTSCGYDNDPTRVYCHSCGVKLEHGAGAVSPPTGFTHPTELMKRKQPRRQVAWGRYFGALVKLALLAGVVAVVALALAPPREVPEPVEPDERLAMRLGSLVRDASAARDARAFAVPSEDVQVWLVSSVQFAENPGTARLQPQRVYAVAGDGELRVGLEALLMGAWNVFFEGDYVPVRTAEGYSWQARRYAIGRLSLPPVLGWPVERQLEGMREALAATLGQLERASYIGVNPESVTLSWPGTER